MNIHLVRDCLDKQAIDENGRKMGRVDGVIIDISGPGRPRVISIEIGAGTLARRLPWPFSTLLGAIARKLSAPREAGLSIPWNKVKVQRNEMIAQIDSDQSPVRELEHWVRDTIITRIPGA